MLLLLQTILQLQNKEECIAVVIRGSSNARASATTDAVIALAPLLACEASATATASAIAAARTSPLTN